MENNRVSRRLILLIVIKKIIMSFKVYKQN